MRLNFAQILAITGLLITPIAIHVTAQTPPISTNPTLQKMLANTSYYSILSPQNFQYKDINLVKGRSISEGIPIDSTMLKDLTPSSAISAAQTQIDLNKVPLSELKFLKQTSLKSVVDANPAIANLNAAAVGWVAQGEKTLLQLAASPLGKNPLPDSVLNATSIGQFGDIANTPYSKYEGAGKQPIANFLGAANVPLNKISKISNAAGAGKVINQIKLDRIASGEVAAGINSRISSGSNKEPHAPCTESGSKCSALEIQGQFQGVTGSMWMVNQKLKGGSGLVGEIATAAGIREYAGYEIPGTDFKIVALSSDPRKGTAQLRLDMRTTSTFGATPFFIPLLPMTVSEKNGNVMLPVEVSPVASTMATPGTASAPTAVISSPLSTELAAILPAKSDYNVDNANIRNGNIGQAVKTNAINPAIGGLQ